MTQKKQDINEKMRSLTREQANALAGEINKPRTKEGREREKQLQRETDALFKGTALLGDTSSTKKKTSSKKK